jgi:ABC-type branched-subunit amino acid transport system substrate-binding protein
MAGQPVTRIGLLLPFKSVVNESQSLQDAAELALFEANDPYLLLIPRESGADSGAGFAAAQSMLKDGAEVIIGPLINDSVAGAGRAVKKQVPIIAFSTDTTVAGDGVYLLTFPFEEEVSRVVDYASRQGLKRIALLAPDTAYGHRVNATLSQEAAKRGGSLVAAQFYQRSEREAAAAAQVLAPQAKTWNAQAIMIADSGPPLRAIGPALLQAGINLQQVKLLGVGWTADAQREPTLSGGWYAATDPAARANFESRFVAAYGRPPTRLASLAYDALGMAEALSKDAGGAGLTRSAIERPDGFNGADGLFRFRANGTIERALAVLEVRAGGAIVIDPAPGSFPAPGS